MKVIFPASIPSLLALLLLAGCGDGPVGSEGFEKGVPVVAMSDLQEVVSAKPNFEGAPADVYEGDIGIWFYKDQPFTGWAVAKFDNGRLQHKEYLQSGLQHGLTRTWYEGGQLKSENNWHHGLPDGLEVMWHGNGNVYVINYWQRGVVLIKKAWDENGAAIQVDGWNEDGSPKIATKGAKK